jgi:hypothetical protein
MRVALLTRRSVWAVGAMLLLIGLSGAMVFTSRGEGWTTSHLHQIPRKNGEFLNYDFTDWGKHSPSGVDWAVSLLFHNAATTSRIYTDFHSHNFLESAGDPIYGYVTDGSAFVGTGKKWHWRGNEGLKEVPCAVLGDILHLRIYAPRNALGAIYTPWAGYVVIGTAHWDHNECNKVDKWSGMSEEAERAIVRGTRGIYGTPAVIQDKYRFWNAEGEHIEEGDDEDHHWEGNGRASAVRVPARRP